jgi:mRNA-degrading endonuclease RelE of RelBE toxin-antitoxin system
VSAALQIYHSAFDAAFFKLPTTIRVRIERKIDDLGMRLGTFAHHRHTGTNRYRLRVGDYRIIYSTKDREPFITDAVRDEPHRIVAAGVNRRTAVHPQF